MNLEDVVNNIVADTAVDLTQEFDRNFERKSFFDRKWPETNHPNSRGSLLNRTGKLRRSINHTTTKGEIRWKSSLPYASIHNEGGDIVVTQAMKRFFWAMYYKSSGAVLFNVRSKAAAKTKRNDKLQGEAKKWKAMALLKIGTKLEIKQRQFIGWHPKVDQVINDNAAHNMIEYNNYLAKRLKQ